MGKAVSGRKVNYVRDYNIKLIMPLLYEQPLSGLELSEKINISPMGCGKILKELEEHNIIRRAKEEQTVKSRGGQHIRYEINSEYGMFLIIDFTYLKETFGLYDFAGRKLFEQKFFCPSIYQNESEVVALAEKIKSTLEEKGYAIANILNVTIAITGQVDEKNRCPIFSGRFKIFEKDKSCKLYRIFENAFGAPVSMKNNVALMAVGEVEAGFESRYGMAIFVSVGHGVAVSILYQGKPLFGWRGYAGEIGGNQFGPETNVSYNCSIVRLIQKCAPHLKTEDFDGLLAAYSENEEVKATVLHGADVLGYVISDLVNTLGADTVMLQGEILEFGKEYKEIFSNKLTERSVTKVDLLYSKLDKPAIRGALVEAKSRAIEKIIAER